jgi:hypothetical protein
MLAPDGIVTVPVKVGEVRLALPATSESDWAIE